MKYRVLDPKGITFRGTKVESGRTFTAPSPGADIRAFLHFQQIKAVEEKPEAPAKPPEPEISDAAKKLADDNQIDLATVTGSGANGLIVKADVEAAIAAKK